MTAASAAAYPTSSRCKPTKSASPALENRGLGFAHALVLREFRLWFCGKDVGCQQLTLNRLEYTGDSRGTETLPGTRLTLMSWSTPAIPVGLKL